MSRPELNHFTGQEVTKVNPKSKNGTQITLVSDASIYGGELPENPDDLVGLLLTLVTENEQGVMLNFQRFENNVPVADSLITVRLDPTTYLIETKDYDPFNPETPDPDEAEETLPADPSPERVNEEPPGGPESGSEPLPVDEGGQITLDEPEAVEERTAPRRKATKKG